MPDNTQPSVKNKTLYFITGPTAAGKTSAAVSLATLLQTEVISCDSRQFYKQMNIGTAVPSENKKMGIRHHFIHHKNVWEDYNCASFGQEASHLVDKLFQNKQSVIMVGGAGLYADALIYGLNRLPSIPPEVRNRLGLLYKKEGIEGLKALLKKKDAHYYNTVDKHNPRRILRALEVCEASQRPYSFFLRETPYSFFPTGSKNLRMFNVAIIILCPERKTLYQRINNRVDEMLDAGLEKEVGRLISFQHLKPLNTIGYREFFDFFKNKISKSDAILKIKQHSRRYAKRQICWCKKYRTAIHISSSEQISQLVS